MNTTAILTKIGGQEAVIFTTQEFGREWNRWFVKDGHPKFKGVKCVKGVPHIGETDRATQLLYPD